MNGEEKDIYKESKIAKSTLKRSAPSNFADAKPNTINPKKSLKVIRPKAAVGGLDAVVYSSAKDPFRNRKGSQLRERAADFKEFDPMKRLRKGGKLGKSSFKSKARYKRRK